MNSKDEYSLTTLRLLSWKVQGIGHLIENYRNDAGPGLNQDSIQYGLGCLISQLGQDIEQLAVSLEDQELKKFKSSRNNK